MKAVWSAPFSSTQRESSPVAMDPPLPTWCFPCCLLPSPVRSQLGDLILERDLQDRGIELLNHYAELIHPVELVNTNQIYCIYLNNLSKKMAADITEGLRDYEGFVGARRSKHRLADEGMAFDHSGRWLP